MCTMTRRDTLKGLAAGIGSLALGTTFAARVAHAGQAGAVAKPELVFHGHGFDPMMSHILTGESIELASVANAALQLASAPGAPEKIARSLAPQAKASLSFSKPGLYLLYDDVTTRFDPKVGQVVARKSAASFPLPAYAAVLVTDPNGRGLTRTAAHVNIPDSYMTFEPWAVVVDAGEPLTFTNNDMDVHVAMPSPEPMLMENPPTGGAPNSRLWLERMQNFVPLTLTGDGGKGAITLSQPGLHHYYCPIHAAYSAADYSFAPLKSYGGYPYIMDGVIVVLPR